MGVTSMRTGIKGFVECWVYSDTGVLMLTLPTHTTSEARAAHQCWTDPQRRRSASVED
jgi:hypothetical protein